MTSKSEGLYVYCIIGTEETRNFGPTGVGARGDVVTTLAYRDLSAVVSNVPMDRYVVGPETMLAHERVIEQVMKDHTVLPVRFYTVAPNAEEVRGVLLRTRYAEFKRLLRELDNKAELGLKALWKDMNQVLGEVLNGELGATIEGKAGSIPEDIEDIEGGEIPARLASSSGPLSEGVRLALDRKKAGLIERLLEPLRPLANELRLNRTYGDDMVMNAAFLVDGTREREFDARVERLGSQLDDLVFNYVGPAPPYSFVNIVIKED